MKKFLMMFVCAMVAGTAVASDYRYETSVSDCGARVMRSVLDNATADYRAVTTVVTCEKVPVQPKVVEKTKCNKACHNHVVAANKLYRVVAREYFVRETVQEYEPVIVYIPTDTYTVIKKVY